MFFSNSNIKNSTKKFSIRLERLVEQIELFIILSLKSPILFGLFTYSFGLR